MFSTVGKVGCAAFTAVGILFYYPLIFRAYSAGNALPGLNSSSAAKERTAYVPPVGRSSRKA